MRLITIYIDHIIYQDGIFTWMCNFYELMKNSYEIEIVTKIVKPQINDILNKKGITLVKWNPNTIYDTDYLLYMLDFVVLPTNFTYRKKFKIIHCNYINGKSEFNDLNDGSEFIAVSRFAANGFIERFKLPCYYIDSFVLPYKPKPVLRLISCSRIYENKGFERMFKLADDLDEFNIRYQWINYSEIDANGVKYLQSKKRNNLITFLPSLSHDMLLDYIASSDYLVQLSDNEGYCYAVHEALMLETPVIVTDIDVFKDIVENGYNGYRLPLDMNYDSELFGQIVNEVPRFKSENDNLIEVRARWKEVLTQ